MSPEPPDPPPPVEPLMLHAQEAGEVRSMPFAAGRAVAYSVRCPGKETPNEDSAAVIPLPGGRGVLAVADGMGGQRAGGQASAIALRALRDALLREPALEDPREAVLNAFEEANRSIADLQVGAGTTLAVAQVADGGIRAYHVGDSVVLLVGRRGKVKLQTVPHSPTGYAVEAGLLDAEEALHHGERHMVTNALGAEDMRIEMGSPLPLSPLDTVLVASDGLFDNLTGEEVVDLVRKGPLEEAAARLAEACLRRMENPAEGVPCNPDDLTFLLYRPDPPPRAEGEPGADAEEGDGEPPGGPTPEGGEPGGTAGG